MSAKDPKCWQTPIIQSPFATLTKEDVHAYYGNPAIQKALLDAVGSREAIIRQNFAPDNIVLRRKDEKGHFIHLTPKRLDAWNEKRLSEVHPTFGKKVDTLLVDIDPKEGVSWEQTKRITETAAKALRSHPDVQDVSLQFSGNRGFYVHGRLNDRIGVDRARNLTKNILGNLAQRPDVSLGTTGQIRLDTTPLKVRGSVRAPYSLDGRTGLVAAPVKLEDLKDTKKQDFTIDKILRKLVKQAAAKNEFAPGISKTRKIHKLPTVSKPEPEWMLAIQEHIARKAGKHYDLRLVQPLTDRAHSWAIPKARLPEKKEKMLLAIQQPTHKRDYALHFTGTLPEGYGAGTVTMPIKEKVRMLKMTPDKVKFERPDGQQFNMFRTKGNNWGIKQAAEAETEKPWYLDPKLLKLVTVHGAAEFLKENLLEEHKK